MKITKLYPMTINTMNRPESRESNRLSVPSLMPMMVQVDTFDEEIVLYTPRTQNKHKTLYWDVMIAIATAYQRITKKDYKDVKELAHKALQKGLKVSKANINNLYKTYHLSHEHVTAKYGNEQAILDEKQKIELLKQLSHIVPSLYLLHSPRWLVFSKEAQVSLNNVDGKMLYVDLLEMLDELENAKTPDEKYQVLDTWMNFIGSSSGPFTFPGAWTFLSNEAILFFDTQDDLQMIDIYTYVLNYLRRELLNIIDAYSQEKTTHIYQAQVTHLISSYIALSFWMRDAKPIHKELDNQQPAHYRNFLEQSLQELQGIIQSAKPEKQPSLFFAIDYLHHNNPFRQEIMFFTHRDYWRIPIKLSNDIDKGKYDERMLLSRHEERAYQAMQTDFKKLELEIISFLQQLR